VIRLGGQNYHWYMNNPGDFDFGDIPWIYCDTFGIQAIAIKATT
jgi:hypothetical protein